MIIGLEITKTKNKSPNLILIVDQVTKKLVKVTGMDWKMDVYAMDNLEVLSMGANINTLSSVINNAIRNKSLNWDADQLVIWYQRNSRLLTSIRYVVKEIRIMILQE